MNRVFRVFLIASASTVLPSLATAQALDSATRAELAREVDERTREDAERLRRQAQTRPLQSDTPSSNAPVTPTVSVAPGGPCFNLRSIRLVGAGPIRSQPTDHLALAGTCATAKDIGEALNHINAFYQERGFVTTRAYVGEQDIADGALDITVVPGTVEGFVYANGRQADDRLLAAFPARKGALLNLRDLEQGLDNLNAPRSADATFQLTPGQREGASRVQVNVTDKRPWRVEASLTNSDAGADADTSLGLTFGLDNSLGINDQLTIGIQTTPFENRGRKYSDGFNIGWTVPVGNWAIDASSGSSRYFFVLPGINQSYDVTGTSRNFSLTASRRLMRNQSAKLFAYGGIKLSRSNTYIDRFEIATQRRHLTIGSLGLRGEKAFETGKLTWDVGTRFGLRAFGADVHPSSIVNREFQLVKARIGYERPIGSNGATYKTELIGQHSKDILPAIEQVSIGGWSTVRGFTSDTMYGDSGLYWRNTVEWDALKQSGLHIRMNAGLDAGYVKPSTLRSWSQDYLIGASLGAEIKINDKATLTLNVARALSRPSENPPNAVPAFEGKGTVGFVGLKVEF